MLSCQTRCKLSDFGVGFSTATTTVISLSKTSLEIWREFLQGLEINPRHPLLDF